MASYPYMGISRHFHVVFDVRVLDLKFSNDYLRRHNCSDGRCYGMGKGGVNSRIFSSRLSRECVKSVESARVCKKAAGMRVLPARMVYRIYSYFN